MILSFTVHMSFWSRLKVLLGYGVRVTVESDGPKRVSVCVPGEEDRLTTKETLDLTLPIPEE